MEFKKWSADNAKYAEWLKIDDLSDSQSIFAYTVNNQKIQRFMESINKYKCMLKEYAAVGKLLQVDYVELENSFVNLLNSSVLELGRIR